MEASRADNSIAHPRTLICVGFGSAYPEPRDLDSEPLSKHATGSHLR